MAGDDGSAFVGTTLASRQVAALVLTYAGLVRILEGRGSLLGVPHSCNWARKLLATRAGGL